MVDIASFTNPVSVILIPLVAWAWRRITPDGRIELRIQRLGRLYALMPDSPQKETFKAHLTSAIEALNLWLDEDAAYRRRITRRISIASSVFGILAVAIALPFTSAAKEPWVAPLAGSVIGLVIVLISWVGAYVLGRRVRLRSANRDIARESAASALRMEAVERGLPLPD